MAIPGGVGVAAHQLLPLVGAIDRHLMAEPGQDAVHEVEKRRIAGRAVAIAQHHVRPRLAGAVLVARGAVRAHRMAVDVPDRAETGVRLVERALDRGMVGPPAALDAALDRRPRQRRVVDRVAGRQARPDQADAAADLGIAHGGPRPRAVDHARVELLQAAVGVDVAAREGRGDQHRTMRRCCAEQLVDIGIGRAEQLLQRQHGREIGRRQQAAVRAVEDRRHGGTLRPEPLHGRLAAAGREALKAGHSPAGVQAWSLR